MGNVVDPASQKNKSTNTYTRKMLLGPLVVARREPLEEKFKVGCPWRAIFWRVSVPILASHLLSLSL